MNRKQQQQRRLGMIDIDDSEMDMQGRCADLVDDLVKLLATLGCPPADCIRRDSIKLYGFLEKHCHDQKAQAEAQEEMEWSTYKPMTFSD
jgi:hypothetical protein